MNNRRLRKMLTTLDVTMTVNMCLPCPEFAAHDAQHAASTRSVSGFGPMSMSSRLRESDDRGGRKGSGYWSGVEKKQRSSEAAVGEVGINLIRCESTWKKHPNFAHG